MKLEFSIAAESVGRLDRFLADQLAISRTQAARLIADKSVQVNGTVARASRALERGDEVAVAVSDEKPTRTIRPAQIPITVVFEDEHLMVIDKPAGLVVHPAPGHWDDTLVNALAARGTNLSGGSEGRPGIVHRLDRDTSGLMVVAKTDLAHRKLGAALAARQVTRRYAALAWGHLETSPLTIEAPVGRHPRDRKRMTVSTEGRVARTDAYVLARFPVCELLRLQLHTGRTHQIRVHLAHVGHAILGDPVYGTDASRGVSGKGRLMAQQLAAMAPRQALHAAWLSFRHPSTNAPVEFTSEWPADLAPLLVAAWGSDPVAQPLSLRYLGFFEGHG